MTNPNVVSVDGAKVIGTVANATNAATANNSTQLGGIAANQYVRTTDSRLTDARNPLPGSANYIQNSSSPQPASNFNITGNGTVGSLNSNGAISFAGIGAPPVAPAGQGRFYYDSAANRFRVSENGAPYVNLIGAGGLSGSGSLNRIPLWTAGSALGDSAISQLNSNIGIGTTSPQGRLHVNGTSWFQGDSTPLPAAAGKGIAAGFAAEQGYIFGFDYNAFTPKNLILNGPGGRVGIGTTTPTATLHIKAQEFGTGARIDASGTSIGLIAFAQSSAAVAGDSVSGAGVQGYSQNSRGIFALSDNGTALYASSVSGLAGDFNGAVHLGRATPGQVQLTVRSIPGLPSVASVCFNNAGDILACGASSLKLKQNIRPFRSGLDIVGQLQPIIYDWKEDGRADFGLGAEDVAKIAPQLAMTNEAGEISGVKYEKLPLLLINAVKEQQAMIERQQKRIRSLERRLTNAERRLKARNK